MRVANPLMLALVFAVAAARPNAAGAQDTKPVDVTGKWTMNVMSDAGSGTPTVTFKQTGDSLSGHYSSQNLGERDFTGAIKDGKIEFGFNAESGGQAFSMYFSGTVESADSMKGSIDFAGMATGSFTARRQKP